MTDASLRWNDTLHIRDLKLKDGVISGILTSSKTSGSPEPFTCPERGFRTLTWSHPIFQFREDFYKDHGEYPIYLFPLINKFWFITGNQAAPRKLSYNVYATSSMMSEYLRGSPRTVTLFILLETFIPTVQARPVGH